LSESGFTGFEDLQDLIFGNLSESGYRGFEDLQDLIGGC
jgi:hypothetical protein